MRVQDEEILQRSSLFRFLPKEHFERLRPLLHEERFEFGDVIVQQGEPADSFYVLLSGRARAIKSDPNGGVSGFHFHKGWMNRRISPREW